MIVDKYNFIIIIKIVYHNYHYFKVPRSEGVKMIERLSKRYDLSDSATSQILRFLEDEAQTGELSLEDEKYFVNVEIRGPEFDIKLSRSESLIDID